MFEHDKYCLENEIWVDIPGYEGIYEASSFGRIRSVDGKETHSERHGVRKWKGRILKNKTKVPCKEGYKVSLWKDKNVKDFLVARLVCSAFNGEEENMTVNHKDGNRFNNRVENLEWLSLANNIRHAFENDLMPYHYILIEYENGKLELYKSMAKASNSLGFNNGYLSNAIKKGHKINSSNGDFIINVYKCNKF